MTPLPKIDLKELKKDKKRNFQSRLQFIDLYSTWLKSQTNKKWSKEQKQLIG